MHASWSTERARRAGWARALIAAALVGALLVTLAGGCARRPRANWTAESEPVPLAVEVYADTMRGESAPAPASAPRVWLAGVAPSRASLPRPPLPEAPPESLPPAGEAVSGLDVDPGLKPPVLRAPARLTVPGGRGHASGTVDLDVLVDASGDVTEARWAAGDADTALVEAARRCALGMRFYPALQAGRPVPVWCRQRFDFGAVRR